MVKDFKIDEQGDVVIKNGDFATHDATMQNQELILLSHKGEWKQSPWVGVGIEDYIDDEIGVTTLHSEIQKQFELDGMQVQKISGKSVIDTIVLAHY